jgi:hypothetical protein
MRAARRFGEALADGELLAATARFHIELYGSLGATARGQGTLTAVTLGLEGARPDDIDPTPSPLGSPAPATTDGSSSSDATRSPSASTNPAIRSKAGGRSASRSASRRSIRDCRRQAGPQDGAGDRSRPRSPRREQHADARPAIDGCAADVEDGHIAAVPARPPSSRVQGANRPPASSRGEAAMARLRHLSRRSQDGVDVPASSRLTAATGRSSRPSRAPYATSSPGPIARPQCGDQRLRVVPTVLMTKASGNRDAIR